MYATYYRTRLINSTMLFLAYFHTETTVLNFNFSGMPVVDGSFGWRWLVIFFGSLTNVIAAWRRFSTESDGVGEKRLWLTGLSRSPAV